MNLEAVYPDPEDPSVEMSFDELRAMQRGWLDRVWAPEMISSVAAPEVEPAEPVSASDAQEEEIDSGLVEQVVEKLVIARDPPVVDENARPKREKMLIARDPSSDNQAQPIRPEKLIIARDPLPFDENSYSRTEMVPTSGDSGPFDENGDAKENGREGRTAKSQRKKVIEENRTQISKHYLSPPARFCSRRFSKNQALITFRSDKSQAESSRAHYDLPHQSRNRRDLRYLQPACAGCA